MEVIQFEHAQWLHGILRTAFENGLQPVLDIRPPFYYICMDDLSSVRTYSYDDRLHFCNVPGGFLDRVRDLGCYTFIPRPLSKRDDRHERLRDLKLPDDVQAVYDPNKRRVTIEWNDQVITFSDVAPVSTGNDKWEKMLEAIATQLIEQKIPVAVTSLMVLDLDEQSNTHHLYNHEPPRVSNGEMSAPVSGWAVDGIHLVYAGVVGHKTALESFKATLNATRKCFSVSRIGNTGISYPLGDKYVFHARPMPTHDVYHGTFVNISALPGKWHVGLSSVYCLDFAGVDDSAFNLSIINRLHECLECPMLDEWADVLIPAAMTEELVAPIATDGDCKRGVSVRIDNARWKSLVSSLIADKSLPIQPKQGV